MSCISSLHTILDKINWDFCNLECLLTYDSSSVNEIDETGLSPLHRVLMDRRRTPNIVKLLIQHGADVNFVPENGYSPLTTALSLCVDKAIIRELLDGGIDHNKIQDCGEFVLCTALFHGNSVEVFKMLIEGGCPLQGCFFHPSILHCALESQQMTLDADLVRLLFEKCIDVNMNLLSRYGQSLLCLSLNRFKDLTLTKMLLDAGCSIYACTRHASLWLCATSYPPMLSLDTVKLVSSTCANFNCVNEVGENPLLSALKYACYEVEAIKFLLDLQSGDINNLKCNRGNTILHAATGNCQAKPDVVKLLIKKGAHVNAVNNRGDTPLHIAVACKNYKKNIIRILMENGAFLNIQNKSRKTPLSRAIRNRLDSSSLQLLLSAGSRVYLQPGDLGVLQIILRKYDLFGCEDNINCCKLFLKYALLNKPDIDVKQIHLQIWPDYEVLHFANNCVSELDKMKHIYVHPDFTLFNFIVYNRIKQLMVKNDPECEPITWDVNNLLQILEDNAISYYLDAVASNIGRRNLEAELRSLIMYTVISSPNAPSVEKKVSLNYESVCYLVGFLTNDDDLLRLLLAFHNKK